MVTKRELLKNIRNYTPQEIANAVRDGVVTLYELSKETEGAFTPLLKRQVKTILETSGFLSYNAQEPIDDTISQPKLEYSSIDTDSNIPIVNSVFDSVVPVEPSIGIMLEKNSPDYVENNKNQSTPLPQKKAAMFSRIFSFKGRIRRLEYGLTYLAYFIWSFPMQVMTESQISEAYAVIYLLSLFPMIWILYAQGAKRCHDRGNSGWFQIIPFYVFWMIFAEGESNTNQYGESPK